MDHERVPRHPTFRPSEKVVWLFPVRPRHWRGEVWSNYEDRFVRCVERLFRAQTLVLASEETLAAAHERLHRLGARVKQ